MESYVSPRYDLSAFNCPFCRAYSSQEKFYLGLPNTPLYGLLVMVCQRCKKITIWYNDKLVYPFCGGAPLANPDMPEDVKRDYNEAREILNASPRGAAALLRLAIQKLCIHLGGEGKNINDDIALLVKNGLPEKVKKALDIIRVIGNNAVHPGQIDLYDDIKTATTMFTFINVICDNQITQPKIIDECYDKKVPERSKDAINKRDGK